MMLQSNSRRCLYGLSIVLLMLSAVDASAVPVPSSHRSEQAIERVRPVLEKELKAKGLNFGDPIFIRIFKAESQLELWVQDGSVFKLYKTYPICTFSGKLGPKLQEGDNQAPEGFYFVTPNAMNPSSTYHLSFNLGYPNRYDRFHKRTGSYLMVHGDCVSIGCFAMTNPGIEEIWALADASLRAGQPFFRVHIFPFRMSAAMMSRYQGTPWGAFWKNLQTGYQWFEDKRRPPDVSVKNGLYVFKD